MQGLVPLPPSPVISTPPDLIARFGTTYPRVVAFLGFGELGYDDLDSFRRVVRSELQSLDPRRDVILTATLVTQGFESGVAGVYELAAAYGFRTAGIFPSVALQTPERYSLSAFVHDIYFVNDHTWGGYLPGSTVPSAMLRTLVAVTDEVVAIGGGKHTAQEMCEMIQHGKPVRYHPLDMNREVSVRWYRSEKRPVADPRGEAFFFWTGRTVS